MLIKLIPENKAENLTQLVPYDPNIPPMVEQTFRLVGIAFNPGLRTEFYVELVDQKELDLRDKIDKCIEANVRNGGNNEALVNDVMTLLKEYVND